MWHRTPLRRGAFSAAGSSAAGWGSTTLANGLLWLQYAVNPVTPPPAASTGPALSSQLWSSALSPSLSVNSWTSFSFEALQELLTEASLASALGSVGGCLYFPFVGLVLCGAFFRCFFTLPFSIYGEAAVRNLRLARPALLRAHHDYLTIAEHPEAISWEKRVAAQKLRNDRQRIFRAFRTNNLKVMAPFAMSGVLHLWFLAVGPVVGGLLGPFLTQQTFLPVVQSLMSAAEAGSSESLLSPSTQLFQTLLQSGYCPSPLLCAVGGSSALSSTSWFSASCTLVDPTLSLASALTYFNIQQHLQQRAGLGPKADRLCQRGKRWSRRLVLGTGVGGAALLLPLWSHLLPSATLTYGAAVLPSYLAPAWLGIAMVSALQHGVQSWRRRRATRNEPSGAADSTASSRSLDMEAASRSMDGLDTTASHPYKLSFSGEDAEERRHMWAIQRQLLEYECDVRIFRLVRRLWTPSEELEEEAEKLQKKVQIARQRRVARQAHTEDGAPSPAPDHGGERDGGGAGTGAETMEQQREREMRMLMKAQEMRNTFYEKKEKT